MKRESGKASPVAIVVLGGAILIGGWMISQKVMGPEKRSFADFVTRANQADLVLELPVLYRTEAEIQTATEQVRDETKKALDRIATQDLKAVTFASTLGALDTTWFHFSRVAYALELVQETHPDPKLRSKAKQEKEALEKWHVDASYREDVYRAVQAFAQTKPALEGEEKKLLADTLRDYRRMGFNLSKKRRAQAVRLEKQLSEMTSNFQVNKKDARAPVSLTRAEMQGAPEDFLKKVKKGDRYVVQPHETWQYILAMENLKSASARKKLLIARYSLAQQKNRALAARIIRLRGELAQILGYSSWADYQIEPKMAKSGDAAMRFVTELYQGLEPKFRAEVDELSALKKQETGTDEPLKIWDFRYYINQLKKKKFSIDPEALRVFFSMEKVLSGMFAIFEEIFDLEITEVDPPAKWVDGLRLFMISDSETKEPLGAVYMDLYPRDGKYNHFAMFPLIEGKRLSSGRYQRPVSALVCNFPPPENGKPSLLSHDHVETLFHEFGHALHGALTQARFWRFSSTNVARDFVEAPSQMLESWIWEPKILDRFAADYRDDSKKIPREVLAKMEEAEKATIGVVYRRQLTFGLMDLRLHGFKNGSSPKDPVGLANQAFADVFFPVPKETSFLTGFGHLFGGYDAGYYGYAWADAIAADLTAQFQEASGGLMNRQVGRKLRDEIYATGSSRDENISVESFLGRKRSLKPFLKKLGIQSE